MLQPIREIFLRQRTIQIKKTLSSEIPVMIKKCPELDGVVPANKWKIQKIFPKLGDMNVAIVGPDDQSVSAILYIPETDRAVGDFNRRKNVLSRLHNDERLSELHQYFPHLLGEGVYKSRPYWIVKRIHGVGLELALHNNPSYAIVQHAIEPLSFFHQKTVKDTIVDEEKINEWVIKPILIILQSPLVYYYRKSSEVLKRLEEALTNNLLGQQVVVSWVHGDYWLNNILVSLDGKQVTGIVDWDLARPDDLPSLDLVNFLLSVYRELHGWELGPLLVKTHKIGVWDDRKVQSLWDKAMMQLNVSTPDLKDSLMIFWIRHLSANLLKSKRYSFNPIWAIKNYRSVIKYLDLYLIR